MGHLSQKNTTASSVPLEVKDIQISYICLNHHELFSQCNATMSKTANLPDELFFITMTIVDWIDLFTRQIYFDFRLN